MRLLLFFFLICSSLAAVDVAPAIPDSSRQLVLVVAPTWASSRGELRRYERPAGKAWRSAGEARPVLLGLRGLAWGSGLLTRPANRGPVKREGDQRAPAGVFALPSAFGMTKPLRSSVPYRLLVPGVEAVDDPASRFYNQIVQRAEIPQVDWRSSERMWEMPDYGLGVVVAHNPRNVPSAGSCIFIHLWRGERTGTAGCTVLRQHDLEELVNWLDARRQPVLVQLPREELPAHFP